VYRLLGELARFRCLQVSVQTVGGACTVQVPSGECTDCWGELVGFRCLQVSVQTVGGGLHRSGAFR